MQVGENDRRQQVEPRQVRAEAAPLGKLTQFAQALRAPGAERRGDPHAVHGAAFADAPVEPHQARRRLLALLPVGAGLLVVVRLPPLPFVLAIVREGRQRVGPVALGQCLVPAALLLADHADRPGVHHQVMNVEEPDPACARQLQQGRIVRALREVKGATYPLVYPPPGGGVGIGFIAKIVYRHAHFEPVQHRLFYTPFPRDK